MFFIAGDLDREAGRAQLKIKSQSPETVGIPAENGLALSVLSC